jgi:hypothetical protein
LSFSRQHSARVIQRQFRKHLTVKEEDRVKQTAAAIVIQRWYRKQVLRRKKEKQRFSKMMSLVKKAKKEKEEEAKRKKAEETKRILAEQQAEQEKRMEEIRNRVQEETIARLEKSQAVEAARQTQERQRRKLQREESKVKKGQSEEMQRAAEIAAALIIQRRWRQRKLMERKTSLRNISGIALQKANNEKMELLQLIQSQGRKALEQGMQRQQFVQPKANMGSVKVLADLKNKLKGKAQLGIMLPGNAKPLQMPSKNSYQQHFDDDDKF